MCTALLAAPSTLAPLVSLENCASAVRENTIAMKAIATTVDGRLRKKKERGRVRRAASCVRRHLGRNFNGIRLESQ